MSNIAPFFIALALCVLSVAVAGYYPGYGASAQGGAVGGQFAQQEGAQETHNDKNFGFNYGKKQGSSSNFKNTAGQAGAAYGAGQVPHPGYYPGWGHQPHGWGPTPPPHGWGPTPPPRPNPGWHGVLG